LEEEEGEILRQAAALFARQIAQNEVPLVLDLAIDGIPGRVTCQVFGFSNQAFYG
jgi:hypothetical protein